MTYSKVFYHVLMIVGKERLGRVGRIWMILVEVVPMPLLMYRRVLVITSSQDTVWHGGYKVKVGQELSSAG